jgi:hypothetical protein
MKIIKLGDLYKLKSSFQKSTDFKKGEINSLIKNIVKPMLIELYFGGNAEEYKKKVYHEVISSTIGRVYYASGDNLENKSILDLGCGSNSDNPIMSYDNYLNVGHFGERTFEPWLCRSLSILGANPIGVDCGSLDGERFEHYCLNLLSKKSLNFIPDNSIDIAHSRLLYSSPQLGIMGGNEEKIKEVLIPQLERIVKPEGIYLCMK